MYEAATRPAFRTSSDVTLTRGYRVKAEALADFVAPGGTIKHTQRQHRAIGEACDVLAARSGVRGGLSR